jgi:predicted nucleotidyltransferase
MSTITIPVEIPQQALGGFCARNHIRKLSPFGSILTKRFRKDSDIDMLIEFIPGHVPGLIELSGAAAVPQYELG